MLSSMYSQLILASALFAVLISRMIATEEEDLLPFEELKDCSRYEIHYCYRQYTRLLFWTKLQQKNEGHFDVEAYRKACSELTETSNCYAGLTRCSQTMRANFTRRENGYRALRALVCDTPTLQGFVMARNCTNVENFKACAAEYKELFNATYDDHYSPELPCRIWTGLLREVKKYKQNGKGMLRERPQLSLCCVLGTEEEDLLKDSGHLRRAV
ncbi:uncharacterized protein [Dermacentor albipictus]|uniref:uncharacterized protein isoform X2 n=1 Tax=Dermacentor albipictus TaxID=60249 RepID=UPI0038FC636D